MWAARDVVHLIELKGTHGTPWKHSEVHCHSLVWRVYQIRWRPFQALWSQSVLSCLEVSAQWWTWWNSHRSRGSQSCSNRTSQCLRCAKDVVVPHWCCLRAWLLWNSIGMFCTCWQLRGCHHLFQARIQTLRPSAYISRLLGVLHVSVVGLSFLVWKVSESCDLWLQCHLWGTCLLDSSNSHVVLMEVVFSHEAILLRCSASATWALGLSLSLHGSGPNHWNCMECLLWFRWPQLSAAGFHPLP